MRIPTTCTHEFSPKRNCRECSREYSRKHRQEHPEYYKEWRRKYSERVEKARKKWKENHPEKYKEIHRKLQRNYAGNNPEKTKARALMHRYPEKYPLDNKCAFCERTEKLEHGHVDYDFPEIYLTVCHRCNCWMEKPIEGD